jgi:hypothetical protein
MLIKYAFHNLNQSEGQDQTTSFLVGLRNMQQTNSVIIYKSM